MLLCLLFTEVESILLTQDEWGRTFLHVFVEFRSSTEVSRLLQEELKSADFIKQILSVRDNEGQNVLHAASLNVTNRHRDPDNLVEVIRYIQTNYSTDGKTIMFIMFVFYSLVTLTCNHIFVLYKAMVLD